MYVNLIEFILLEFAVKFNENSKIPVKRLIQRAHMQIAGNCVKVQKAHKKIFHTYKHTIVKNSPLCTPSTHANIYYFEHTPPNINKNKNIIILLKAKCIQFRIQWHLCGCGGRQMWDKYWLI